jgi:hypothetical protein
VLQESPASQLELSPHDSPTLPGELSSAHPWLTQRWVLGQSRTVVHGVTLWQPASTALTNNGVNLFTGPPSHEL